MATKIRELIQKVELLASGGLLVVLKSGGRPSYQHIYREARGVYWDQDRGGFKSPEGSRWTNARKLFHVVSVCSSIGIDLHLPGDFEHVGLSEEDVDEILSARLKKVLPDGV